MSTTFEFEARARSDHGKAATRRLRREQDLVPAIVYGAGKEPQSITMLHKDIFYALQNEAVFTHILKLTIDGSEENVVIKDVQRHAYKPKIAHVDFLRVKMKEKITINVPLHFGGEEEAPGVKSSGGKFIKSITEIEIRCLPADLPEFIAVDVSAVELDQVLHLSDIQLPQGVELTVELDEEHDQPVISCHVPKVTQEDIEAEQHEAELAEEASAESATEVEGEAPAAAAEGEEGKPEAAEDKEDGEKAKDDE